MKKVFMALAIIVCYAANAHGQTILNNNGIFYQVLPNQQDVAVIMPQEETVYSGKIVIPATITTEGNTYKVTHILKDLWKLDMKHSVNAINSSP